MTIETATPELGQVIHEIIEERWRAIAKHGEQLDVPDFGPYDRAVLSGSLAKQITDSRFKLGTGSWADILLEEVAEAFDEQGNPEALRAELIQVAQVALSWAIKLTREQGIFLTVPPSVCID